MKQLLEEMSAVWKMFSCGKCPWYRKCALCGKWLLWKFSVIEDPLWKCSLYEVSSVGRVHYWKWVKINCRCQSILADNLKEFNNLKVQSQHMVRLTYYLQIVI